nr:ATPase histone chaperone abo1-like [Anser cygnoides]
MAPQERERRWLFVLLLTNVAEVTEKYRFLREKLQSAWDNGWGNQNVSFARYLDRGLKLSCVGKEQNEKSLQSKKLPPTKTATEKSAGGKSSIISTLLTLLDDMDNRGEIVVVGATNRLDSIDPALRRPGRFDREFLFNLPDKEARKEIFKIHTRDRIPKPPHLLLDELAEKCIGNVVQI